MADINEAMLAVIVADRFISIREASDGYYYSVIDMNYKKLIGGVYYNFNRNIHEVLNAVMKNLREDLFNIGVGENIGEDDEIIPIDYDELMEQVKAANQVRRAKIKEPKSIFSIKMYGEQRFYENIGNFSINELCRLYAECSKPFAEMGRYGKPISEADFAYIQQGDELVFSVEFDADTNEIITSDGEHFVTKELRSTRH